MYRIITGTLVLMLLALEELLFQSLLKKGKICRSFCGTEDGAGVGSSGAKVLGRIRLAQLLVLAAMIFPIHTSSHRQYFLFPGQMIMTAAALQLIRMMGRQVLRHWSVLGEIQVFQAFFLVLGITITPVVSGYPSGNWVTLLAIGMVFFKALNATALAFSVTYASRGLFSEASPLFQSNPPMAFSDYWAGRICSAAIPLSLGCLATMLVGNIGNAPFRVLFSSSVGLLLASWVTFRFKRAHHPAAHVFIAVSNLLLLAATLFGFAGD